MKNQVTKICGMLVMITIMFQASAQQWGLYTLYAPKNTNKAYLIDTMDTPGTFKTWTFATTKKNGYSTYLIKGDTLVRSYAYSSNSLTGGGITGGFQKVAWDGTVTWDVVYSTSSYCMHHDICPMPNGNVLLISYEVKSATEAQQAGASYYTGGIWSEKIMELKQTGPTTYQVVWEWHLWDHLCQEVNASYNNYVSDVLDHPELMDINYKTFNSMNSKDRFHMNGLDYNEERDQIAISMHFPNELYIIDHSTTTAEAAGHTGGNAGKGGDFLYRWGYPANYDASGTANFNTIHDAHWIAADHPTYPNYLCAYNNQGGTGGKTAVDIWNPPYDGLNFLHTPGTAYSPSTYAYRYNSTFTATNEGNSQQLPNGNILVNNAFGAIYEVSPTGTVLWQKSSASSSHAYRFTKCFIRGHEVTASASPVSVYDGNPVNLSCNAVSVTETSPAYTYEWSSGETTQNPTVYPTQSGYYTVTVTNTAIGCTNTASVFVEVLPTSADYTEAEEIRIYPNPASGIIYFSGITVTEETEIVVYNSCGAIVMKKPAAESTDISILPDGMYYISVVKNNTTVVRERICLIK